MKKLILISLLILLVPCIVQASFDRNLYYGLQKDTQVMELQEFLTDQGIYSGPITGNFFSLTLGAVKQFQIQQELPSTGYFGVLSRQKANDILNIMIPAQVEIVSSTQSVSANEVANSLQTQISFLLQQIALLKQQIIDQQTTEQETPAIGGINEVVNQQTQAIEEQTEVIKQQSAVIDKIQQKEQIAPEVFDLTKPIITSFVGEFKNISWVSENTNYCNIYFGDGVERIYPFQMLHTKWNGSGWIIGSKLSSSGIMTNGANGWTYFEGRMPIDLMLECYGDKGYVASTLEIR